MSKPQYDKTHVFSPEGSLFQVEYAFKAVKACGVTAIALRGPNAAVIVCQRKVPDRLMKGASLTNIERVDSERGVCLLGRPADATYVLNYYRNISEEYHYQSGHSIPLALLAKRVAQRKQIRTQESGYRIMGVTGILLGVDTDDTTGVQTPQIYKITPAGNYLGYFATADGQKLTDAEAELLKLMPPQGPGLGGLKDLASVGKQALKVLQKVLGQSLKATDVELGAVVIGLDGLGVVQTTNHNIKTDGSFTSVPNTEIEKWLEAIAQED